MLLCLCVLSTIFYACGSTDAITFLSSGTIIYARASATLRFKSGFESPVEIVYTSSNGQTQRLGYGDVADYSWSDLHHLLNYVEDGSVGYSVDTQISGVRAHSGSRSLYQEQTDIYGISRNQLIVYANDGQSNNPETLSYMSKMYTSTWIYYKPDLDLKAPGGWMVILSYREFSSPNYSNVLFIKRDSTQLYWQIRGQQYTSPQTHYYTYNNKTVEVPRGRWFHLETYIERHETKGVFRVWVDGVSVFNQSNIRTTTGTTSSHFICVAKVMLGSGSVSDGQMPIYHWVDDVEIWDGMPSGEE